MKKKKQDGERWGFMFEALPDEVPAAVRVRRLLKIALRSLRLKNVGMIGADEVMEMRELQADEE